MSRSDKTMPQPLQSEDGAVYFQWGGIYRGMKAHRQRYNRAERNRVRRQLRKGDEAPTDAHRHQAKWEMY